MKMNHAVQIEVFNELMNRWPDDPIPQQSVGSIPLPFLVNLTTEPYNREVEESGQK
jgi:hypothetical protein